MKSTEKGTILMFDKTLELKTTDNEIIALSTKNGHNSFCQLDLVSTASTPWAFIVLVYPSSKRRLAEGEAPSLSVGGAPDCHQNRQNQTIRFAKPVSLISAASVKSFRFLSDLFGNTKIIDLISSFNPSTKRVV
jgi:hypothetical protein